MARRRFACVSVFFLGGVRAFGFERPFFFLSPAFSRGLELGDPKSDRCGDTGHFHVT